MSSPSEWVGSFLARAGQGLSIDRRVEEPHGFDAGGVLQVLDDSRLDSRSVIEALTDLMHPTDSMYFDAIFGAFHGQVAIRNWLVPTMGDISFIEFEPTAPTEVFSHARGTSSIDEWQMWANLGDDRLPLPRGVSTRHYRDGWVTWNADVYDTAPMRVPPPDVDPAMAEVMGDAEPEPLPPPPAVDWPSAPMVPPPPSDALREWLDTPSDHRGPLDHADIHTVMITPELGLDPDVVGPLWHPSQSRLVEPTAEFTGAAAIQAHLGRRRDARTSITLEQIGPALFNGSCTAFEWIAQRADGDWSDVRGTSVCRYGDGLITYAADYYDTAAT
ncbi:MAG: hypothetical protein AAGD33_18875 [Actinomycetota bacterium]